MNMIPGTRPEAIARLADEYEVLVANTPGLVRDCVRLRHQAQGPERPYEVTEGEQEGDAYDVRARHVLLRHRQSGRGIGAARIIRALPPSNDLEALPMGMICAPGLLEHLPASTTGEISRFAVSRQHRSDPGAGRMIRLGLFQGLFRLSDEMGLTHWVAIMEPVLPRLLRTVGIDFVPLGPLVENHGVCQPACCDVGATLRGMRVDHPDVWGYVTPGARRGAKTRDRKGMSPIPLFSSIWPPGRRGGTRR